MAEAAVKERKRQHNHVSAPSFGKPINKFVVNSGRDPIRANGMGGPRAMTRSQWEVAQASSGRPLTDDKWMRYAGHEVLEERLRRRTSLS